MAKHDNRTFFFICPFRVKCISAQGGSSGNMDKVKEVACKCKKEGGGGKKS